MPCVHAAGYVGEKDPKQCAVEHMIETSDWRKENDIETALTPKRLPENRQEFERLWRSSIIGEDADGHPIVMESIGKIPTKEFAAAFTGDAAKEANFLAHSAFNKEVLRGAFRALGSAAVPRASGIDDALASARGKPRAPHAPRRPVCVPTPCADLA